MVVATSVDPERANAGSEVFNKVRAILARSAAKHPQQKEDAHETTCSA
jgi:hypothetical protein